MISGALPRTEFFPFSLFLAYLLLNILPLKHATYLGVQFGALLGAFSLHRNGENCWRDVYISVYLYIYIAVYLSLSISI